MNTGKTLFAQLHGLPAMDYFHADRRPVWRRSPGPDAFLRRAIPVHAQLTYRESLRDIETCLSVHASSQLGFRQPLRRSTLAGQARLASSATQARTAKNFGRHPRYADTDDHLGRLTACAGGEDAHAGARPRGNIAETSLRRTRARPNGPPSRVLLVTWCQVRAGRSTGIICDRDHLAGRWTFPLVSQKHQRTYASFALKPLARSGTREHPSSFFGQINKHRFR